MAGAKGRFASSDGARQLITYFVGQVVGQMNSVKSCRQVVFDMVEEYIETMEAASKLVES